MKKVFLVFSLVLFAGFVSYSSTVEAASAVQFPAGWKSWTSISTTLTKIPGCEADVSALPPIYQDMVATYCSVKPGGPGTVAVLVNPASVDVYSARNRKFQDGANLILHLKDMNVLFVTAHKGGVPVYGVFSEDGKNITAPKGPLSAQTCTACHTGYQAFCVNGQCGKTK